MRTIKFRAWDNHYKYMNYKVLVGVYGEWENVKDDENYTACAMWIEPDKVDYKCEPHWANFEPYHNDICLMQYTGLKDKNGVEIYEGDLVNYMYVDYMGKEHFIKNQKVKDDYKEWITLEFSEDLEVIGNIYENKELLGSEE